MDCWDIGTRIMLWRTWNGGRSLWLLGEVVVEEDVGMAEVLVEAMLMLDLMIHMNLLAEVEVLAGMVHIAN